MKATNERTGPPLAAIVVGALVLGGIAGAGVGLRWYGPMVGVAAAVAIGLSAGAVVLRAALRAKRARRRPS